MAKRTPSHAIKYQEEYLAGPTEEPREPLTETDAWLDHIRKSNTSRMPTDPKERMEHTRFLSKVEMVRKAFDGEVIV